jgi:hypothetical protein
MVDKIMLSRGVETISASAHYYMAPNPKEVSAPLAISIPSSIKEADCQQKLRPSC